MRTIVALVTLSLCVTSGIRACGNQERATPTVQSSAPAKRPAATSNAAPVSNASANLSAANSSKPHGIKLSWTASAPLSKQSHDRIIGYNIYRSTKPHVRCTPKNKITSVDGSVTSYTDSDAKPGKRYYYVATAVAASGRESDHPSNEASEAIK